MQKALSIEDLIKLETKQKVPNFKKINRKFCL